METILQQLRQELRNNVDAKTQASAKHFFKEDIKIYGIKALTVQKIAKDFLKSFSGMSKQEVFDLCESLWASGYMEESFVACCWSFAYLKQFEPGDLETFDRWIRNYVSNWASCDTLCNHTVGEFIEKYPSLISRLKEWAASDNRWVRRAASVSLIVPARKGLFLKEIQEIAFILLEDKDDMVQKGYGWMLKAASQAHQQEVFEFVVSHKSAMPRTALRYAIEKMPAELKAEAMKK